MSVLSKAIESAVKREGDLGVVQWLVHNYCPDGLPFAATEAAARLGEVRVMEWITANHTNTTWLSSYSVEAAMHGHVEALQWLAHNSDAKCPPHAMATAVEQRHFAITRWLLDRSSDMLMRALCGAIAKGRFEIAQRTNVPIQSTSSIRCGT
ncbi:Ankyrin repeat-containing protein [Globisporangium polare]